MNPENIEKIATQHGPEAPRVSLAQVKQAIQSIDYFHPAEALPDPNGIPKTDARWTTTVCVCVLKNGWVVMGKTTPADHRNFNAQVGKDLAYEDCIKQIWPLLGFHLRQQLFVESHYPDKKSTATADL